MSETLEQARQAVAYALQIAPEDVVDDLTFGDLPQWDSMGHMEIMLTLEERFGIEITPESINALTSLAAIAAAIAAR